MKIIAKQGDITQQNVDVVIVNLFEGVISPRGATGAVDQVLQMTISKLIVEGEIKGKKGELTLLHTLGQMNPSRVLVVGLGKETEFDQNTVRSLSAQACRHLRDIGVKTVATVSHGAGIGGIDPKVSGLSVAEGAILGLYRFDKYKSDIGTDVGIEELIVIESDDKKIALINEGIREGVLLAEVTNLCRDMANEPANHMTPSQLADRALEVSETSGLKIHVLGEDELRELGMGAFLGVAQGSNEKPKLIVLRYEGDQDHPENILAFLGKGITFDTGGISIKPSANMGAMKGDMAGGAAVISAMRAIGVLRPKVNVTAIVPATENMPGGKAQRPGDIVRSMSGKTIEIDNTDAEGRLVLADAVEYALSLGATKIVDVATLTGAMSIALGSVYVGIFGNNQDLVDDVIEAGRIAGERFWQLPISEDYKNQYSSDIADIKNTGGRAAGSITGAQIIGEFAKGVSWAHLDIAATSRVDSTRGHNVKGATGIAVRTLVRLAQRLQSE